MVVAGSMSSVDSENTVDVVAGINVFEVELANGHRVRVGCSVDGGTLKRIPDILSAERSLPLPVRRSISRPAAADIRKEFDGFSLLVQEQLRRDLFSVQLSLFPSKRGHLIKALWLDQQELCFYSKRLENGWFVWPTVFNLKILRWKSCAFRSQSFVAFRPPAVSTTSRSPGLFLPAFLVGYYDHNQS